ncbi:MAG: trigger factor [Chloroflexi bacterium]|nr:trigger factor [Chloroflexota bacterium]
MKVDAEHLEKCQVALQVEVEPEQLERSLDRAYRRLANRTNIPGFRRGKAPRFMVERFLGKAALMEEALDLLVPEAYKQAVQEQEISTLGQPHIEILQIETGVTFKATVATRPTVELGDYKQLSFTADPTGVTEEQVKEEIAQLQQRYAPWEPVERPVAFDDLVTMDIESKVEGNPFINQKEAPYLVMRDSPVPIAGFAEKLTGMAKDEAREFSLTLPDDYPNSEYAGKPVDCTVRVFEIKAKQLAPLDDEFAKGVGAGFESLSALREALEQNLKANAEREAREKLEGQVVDALVGLARMEYPDLLVEHEIDHLMDDDRSLPRDRQGRIDEYLAAVGQSREQFREQYREEATRRVERSLALEKVAELEETTVTPEDLDAEIGRMVEGSGEQEEALRRFFGTPQTRASLERVLFRRKTVQRLIDLTTDKTEVPAPTATEAPAGEGHAPEAEAPAAAPARGRGRRRAESKEDAPAQPA